MTEPLTDEELDSWRITLSTLRPSDMHPISQQWLERFLATIDADRKDKRRLKWLVGMLQNPHICCKPVALTVADYPGGK